MYIDIPVWSPKQFGEDATYVDGIMRWKSNGNIPPNECLHAAEVYCYPVDVKKSQDKRSYETMMFLDEYRRNPPKLTEEDICEMRAAFGPGETVVNVITGKRIQL